MAITLETLLIKEEVSQLRLAYSAHFDSANLDALVDLFTEDAVCDFGDYGKWEGRDVIREQYRDNIARVGEAFDSLHIVTNPWITITGPDTAHGRWYLVDCLTRQTPASGMVTQGGHANPMLYLALYEDDYRKVGDVWKIAYTRLHFLWPNREFKALVHP